MIVRSEKIRTRNRKLFLLFWAFIVHAVSIQAQEFSVESFRLLPNDVSAFIHPVRDLNNEACALIKVEAPQDFAFSSPLGVVKRKDEVGEIWLYLPKGTKTLTLKHPEWGVLRDYRLGKPLESRMTYELKLNLPKPEVTEIHDTITQVKTVVDTVTIQKTRLKMPLRFYTLATIALHEDSPSYGIFFALMRRHGLFVHASGDLCTTGSTIGHCDKQGNIDNQGTKPYYTGDTRHSNLTMTVGAIHRLSPSLNLFEGVGYGRSATAWQQSQSEGGGYVLNDGLTHKGVAAELGMLATFGKLSISASAITIAGKQWQGCLGFGIKL